MVTNTQIAHQASVPWQQHKPHANRTSRSVARSQIAVSSVPGSTKTEALLREWSENQEETDRKKGQ